MPDRRFRSTLRRFFSPHSSPAIADGQRQAEQNPVAVLFRILGAAHDGADPDEGLLDQLAFILEHEPAHRGLQKRWLLHRLPDSELREQIVALLDRHQQPWDEIPFEPQAYAACWTDIGSVPEDCHPWSESFRELDSEFQGQILAYVARRKTRYLFNLNEARNHALRLAAPLARWVFPWDGCCFLTSDAWHVIRPLLDLPELAYLAVPSSLLDDRQSLLCGTSQPPLADGLPLLGFLGPSEVPYNAGLDEIGEVDTDLLRRLGLPGPWLHEEPDVVNWSGFDITPVPDRGRLVQAGWVYRLPPHPPGDSEERRENARLSARRIDMKLVREALDSQPLHCWHGLAAAKELIPGLQAFAANARAVPPLSVTDKPANLAGLPERQYVNAVPHWQSLAGSESTIQRGVLSGVLFPVAGDVSQNYDRTRLQLMVDCVCTLALDSHLNDDQESRRHAVRLVRAWFLEPATAMIPDGAYARLSGSEPARSVLDAALDFRDFFPLIDALSLLLEAGCFTLAERQQLDAWFDAFLAWLASESAVFLQANSGRSASTWYHLLMLAIASYRGRLNVACQVFDNLPGLLDRQFRPDGSPRSAPSGVPLSHEHLFNLQAWSNLVVITTALGRDLMAFRDSNGVALVMAFAYAHRHLPEEQSSHAGVSARSWLAAMQVQIQPAVSSVVAPDLPPLADASTGLPPFWTLCSRAGIPQ
ncbi:alginate lyase family protein [Synechococcus sp. CBW1004]|uniref:alginate lyase family protein n=1 Tax=Synechococcus sp. CBW1004 TaxID=1353136 RepID=UPI0018CE2792|nr:alginate lyase family protein [Synechococcus sp. CBW1004]QPN62864.1 alginate lyase family protein [Synechococcus sp. CBW1004]